MSDDSKAWTLSRQIRERVGLQAITETDGPPEENRKCAVEGKT